MISPITLRHELHKNPELMFEEFKTTELLLAAVEKLPGLTIHRPLETGLVAEYKVNTGEYLLFRADIDALPIKELTGVSFASGNNNMHACGHDIHSSILYGFIKEVVERKIDKNILFVFQPGEEGGGGAERVLNSGLIQQFPVSNAFALHVIDEYDFGTVATTNGVLFAAALEINIDIIGKSAHIAFPDKGINAFKHLIAFLQKADAIVDAAPKPNLYGYGKVFSGTARNIIPEHARAESTLRTMKVELQKDITGKFIAELEKMKQEAGIDFTISFSSPYTEVVVNSGMYQKIVPALIEKFTVIDCGYKLTAEDFGLFSRAYPSFMCWLGTGREKRYGLHTPYFLPEDEIIAKGVELDLLILQQFL
ncbi:MAG: amidohydrolase [Ignavibacteriales bacterium]|nr:amidohydrolase [Ignavibacteriales bacterium]